MLLTGDFNVHLGTLPCGSPLNEGRLLWEAAACAWTASLDELPAGPADHVGVHVLRPTRGVCPAPVGGRLVSSGA